jgi:hypothetical protein
VTDIIDLVLRDHQTVEQLFDELRAARGADNQAQLVATTKHHVGVEEAELLPDFRNNSEASERESLGREFEKAKMQRTTGEFMVGSVHAASSRGASRDDGVPRS